MKRTQIKNISAQEIDSTFIISGWVERVRDHGGVIFLDIRDASGLMQVVVEPDDQALFKKSESIRMSFVLEITGSLRKRPEGTTNESLSSGELELVAKEINILSIFIIAICSIFVTILVSIFPAKQAAKQDPIKSLKYE